MSASKCLKDIRYKLGLTQYQFAAALKINKGTYSLYELGKRKPGFPNIRKIIENLNKIEEFKKLNVKIEYSNLRDDE